MEFLNKTLTQYIESHTQAESSLLKQIDRETQADVLMPRMLSGQLQGQVLAMFCAMIRPKNILEIGTFTGYSAICMAEYLRKESKLITIDINQELEDRVRNYISQSKNAHQIQYIVGNALQIIPTLDMKFDLVFIDADKVNYGNYFDLIINKVSDGGFLIADNVLWSGKVAEPNTTKKDKDLDAILAFNTKIQNDVRVFNVLFPIRDGLMVMRKK